MSDYVMMSIMNAYRLWVINDLVRSIKNCSISIP